MSLFYGTGAEGEQKIERRPFTVWDLWEAAELLRYRTVRVCRLCKGRGCAACNYGGMTAYTPEHARKKVMSERLRKEIAELRERLNAKCLEVELLKERVLTMTAAATVKKAKKGE